MARFALRGREMSDPAKRMGREEAAKLAGVSPDTVRHYQRRGLLHPEKQPNQTGFKYVYSELDVQRIRQIALENLDYLAGYRPGLVRYFIEKAQAQERVLPVSDTGQLYPRGTEVR